MRRVSTPKPKSERDHKNGERKRRNIKREEGKERAGKNPTKSLHPITSRSSSLKGHMEDAITEEEEEEEDHKEGHTKNKNRKF